MRKALFLLVIAASNLLAWADPICQHVGGGIVTNFLSSTTTFGSATGDLGGGIGVTVLKLTPGPGGVLTLHNQHHWVTTQGDTVLAQPADLTAYPSGQSGLYAATYAKGVIINGGTGRFAHGKGTVFAWGAIDTTKGEVTLRYEGTVCFSDEDEH
jgi:hypothetical protein